MKLALDTLGALVLVAGLAGIGIFLGFGLSLFHASICFKGAMKLAESGNYKAARKELTEATRAMPYFGTIPDVQKLYNVLVSEKPDQIAIELIRISDAEKDWPKSRMHRIALHPRFWAVLCGFLVYAVIFITLKS